MNHVVDAAFAAEGLAAGGHSVGEARENATVQVFVNIPVAEAARVSFMDVMRANALASRQEPGNISFHVFENEDGGSAVYLFERWRDQAAFEEHLKTEHLEAIQNILPTSTVSDMTFLWLEECPQIPAKPTDDERVTPRNVVVIFEASDETRAAFLDAIAKVVPSARTAPGNLGFNLFQVRDEPNRFLVFECWASAEHHEAHLNADYCQQFNQALGGILTADPMDHRWLLKGVEVVSSQAS